MPFGLRASVAQASALALSLTFFAGACAPKNPPAIATVEPKTLTVPMPLPPKDTSMFAYLKIRDLKATIDVFGAPAVMAPLMQRGGDPKEVQAGKPAAFYLWDPGSVTSPAAMPIVALLPVPTDGTLIAGLKTWAATVQLHIEPSGEGTLAAMNAVAADHAKAEAPALQDILTAQLPFEGLLYLNASTILDKYLPVLRQSMRGFEPMLAMAAAQRKDAPNPKSIVGMMEQMLGALENVRAVAVGVKPYDGGIELSTMVQDRQPGQGGPVPAADLASFLPPADIRLAWNSRDLKPTIDFYLRMYGPMLDEKPGLRAQVQGLIDEWMKASRRMESAASFQIGGEKGFRGHGLMRVDNPAGVMAVMRKTLGLFNQGAIHDLYKTMGIDFQIVHKPKVRKLKGWAVDRYEYRLAASPESEPPATRAIWDKLNGTTYEVAQIGPFLVYATNGTIDEVVSALFTGKGPHPMKSTTVFPPGGGIYLDANIPALIAGIRQLAPPNVADRLPYLPPLPDLVTLYSYDAGETSLYKLRLPGLLLASLGGNNQ
jgi:hypothetical protein